MIALKHLPGRHDQRSHGRRHVQSRSGQFFEAKVNGRPVRIWTDLGPNPEQSALAQAVRQRHVGLGVYNPRTGQMWLADQRDVPWHDRLVRLGAGERANWHDWVHFTWVRSDAAPNGFEFRFDLEMAAATEERAGEWTIDEERAWENVFATAEALERRGFRPDTHLQVFRRGRGLSHPITIGQKTWLTATKPAPEVALKHLPGLHDQKTHGRRKRAASVPDQATDWRAGVTATVRKIWATLYPNKPIRLLGQAYEVEHPESGLHTRITSIKALSDPMPLLWVEGGIFAGDQEVGRFSRRLDAQGVFHDHLTLNREYEGKGFGTFFYKQSEAVYLKLGVPKVHLVANLEVGGYAWARMGFDFGGEFSRHDVYERVIDLWRKRYPRHAFPTVMPEKPWQIATLQGPDGYPIGKAALLGSNWYGIKRLNPNAEGFRVGLAYYREKSIKRKRGKVSG